MALLLASAPAAQERDPAPRAELDVRVVALIEDEVFTGDDLIDAMLVLGRPALEAAWAVALGYAPAPETTDAVPEELWDVLLEEAAHGRVVEALYATLPDDADYAALLQAVERLVARRETASIPLVVDLATRLSDTAVRSSRTRRWMTRGLLELARTDPAEATALLLADRHRMPWQLASSVDLALLDAGSSEPLERMRRSGQHERQLVDVLRGVRRLRGDLPHTAELVDTLESLLSSYDDRVRALAVEGIASRGATRFTERWVELTSDWSTDVQRAARRALATTTGVHWPTDTYDWESWWALELAWIDDELPELVDALHGRDAAGQVRAVRLMLQHPSAAHLFVPELEARAHDADVELAARCVGALGALAEPEARRVLLGLLEDDRDEVREAAEASLANLAAPVTTNR